MANENSSGNGALYFLVGALCVAVAIGGYFMFNGAGTSSSVAQSPAPAAASAPAPTETKNITIEKKTVETPSKVIIERK